MPDWKREVREHLAEIDLPAAAKEEVISELAAHMEDSVRYLVLNGGMQ